MEFFSYVTHAAHRFQILFMGKKLLLQQHPLQPFHQDILYSSSEMSGSGSQGGCGREMTSDIIHLKFFGF